MGTPTQPFWGCQAVGLLEALRRHDGAVNELGTDLVAGLVERKPLLCEELSCFSKHCIDQIGVELRVPVERDEEVEVEKVVECESELVERGAYCVIRSLSSIRPDG